MLLLRNPKKTQNVLNKIRQSGKTIGFVPTMGYLHEGHLSLVCRSKKENKITVVSIFVNPLQFGPKEDFKNYPRNLRRDLALLKSAGADLVWVPQAADLYPEDFKTTVSVSSLTNSLCGKSRPTHFAGVTTVVSKLLNIVSPHRIYLGQKDYQQFKVIEKMILDLNIPVQAVMAPIVRESDGLAMSSRNVRLSPPARRQALVLQKSLKVARDLIGQGERSIQNVRQCMKTELDQASLGRMDYVEIVDALDLKPVVKLRSGQKVLAAVAVYFGKTRLIDNELIKV